jgi:N-methylhydantoinase A
VDDGPITEALVRGLDARFAAEHERTYGHAAESDPVELVHLRVAATAVTDETRSWPTGGPTSEQPPPTRRPAYFGREHGPIDTPVLTRSAVGSRPIPGPAIVEEYDATTVVPPGYVIWRDEADNLVLELGAES